MKKFETPIPGMVILEPVVFEDDRGFFYESYNRKTLERLGLVEDFVQDNHSRSKKGVLRGLHYQIRHPQGKLVRVVIGEIYDVAVDIRRSSSTFGKWFGVRLSAQNRRQVYVPVGCAHGFLVLSEWAEVLYKATDYYSPEHERCILWNDPEIGIEWPLDGDPILSPKDSSGLRLMAADLFH